MNTCVGMTLERDPKLPHLSMAWSPPRMVEFFNRHVLATACVGRQATGVSLDYINYMPGRRCVLLYELRFADRRDERPFRAVVTFNKDAEKFRNVPARHGAKQSGFDQGSASDSVLFLPNYGCLIEFFPHDWKMPALATACSPDDVTSFLFGNAGDAPRSSCEVTVLRYKPHLSCVLLYSWQAPATDRRQDVIGKIYGDGRTPDAKHMFRVQSELHSKAGNRGLNVPRPIAVMDGLNVLLMERVPGALMADLLHETAERDRLVRTAAKALAILHSLPFDGTAGQSLPRYLERLRKHIGRLRSVVPDLVAEIEDRLGRIEPFLRQCRSPDLCLVHGDYNPSQILIDNGSVAVVDFDATSLGDPAMDVGYFMAQLMREALLTGDDQFRELCKPFHAEYLEQARPANGFEERARAIQGLVLTRMAVRAFRKAPTSYEAEGPASLPVLLLSEAEACIGEL